MIQELLRDYKPGPLCLDKIKALEDIRICRTEELGGFILKCQDCGHEMYHYRSCGNRNCPVCQDMKQKIWVETIMSEALDLPYYHVVFTVPDILNPVFLHEPRKMYDILFSSASQTLMQLGKDKRWVGGKLGFLCVLHTWGSNLSLHPHLHVILIGAGLDKGRVMRPKHDGYMFPVRIISKLFRGKFLDLMRSGSLPIPAGIYDSDWVVYNKETDTGEHIIRYLGRYTHRVAITDSRIVKVTDMDVTFSYKDYRDGKIKQMTLSRDEFCRRFLLHVLPKRFRKIRFYGFLANRNKKGSLALIRKLLCSAVPVNRLAGKSQWEIHTILYGESVCPCCGSHNLEMIPIEKPYHMIA